MITASCVRAIWRALLCVVSVQARQLSVETDMKPVVACLQSLGLTDREIVKASQSMSSTASLISISRRVKLWYAAACAQADLEPHTCAYP